jgi:hypothetical protein
MTRMPPDGAKADVLARFADQGPGTSTAPRRCCAMRFWCADTIRSW